jgi:hypothetical protein
VAARQAGEGREGQCRQDADVRDEDAHDGPFIDRRPLILRPQPEKSVPSSARFAPSPDRAGDAA